MVWQPAAPLVHSNNGMTEESKDMVKRLGSPEQLGGFLKECCSAPGMSRADDPPEVNVVLDTEGPISAAPAAPAKDGKAAEDANAAACSTGSTCLEEEPPETQPLEAMPQEQEQLPEGPELDENEFEVEVEEGVTKLGWTREFDTPMLILTITPDKWAEKAGLKVGDEIMKLDGWPVTNMMKEDADHFVKNVRPLRIVMSRKEEGVEKANEIQQKRISKREQNNAGLTEAGLKKAMTMEEEIRRLKTAKGDTKHPVQWKDGKLVLTEDSDNESEEEMLLERMTPLEREIYMERKKVGIKKAVGPDCCVM